MISEMDKRRFIDKLAMTCDGESTITIISRERLDTFFKEFDYKVTGLLKEFSIEYDKVYEDLDTIKNIVYPPRTGIFEPIWILTLIAPTISPFDILTQKAFAYKSAADKYAESVKNLLTNYVRSYKG